MSNAPIPARAARKSRARRLRTDPAEHVEGQAAGDVALERSESQAAPRIVGGERRPVLGEERHLVALREGHDLRHVDAFAGGLERIGERVGADERDVDDQRVDAELPRPLGEYGAWLVRADDDDRVGPDAAEREQRGLHRRRVADIGAGGRRASCPAASAPAPPRQGRFARRNRPGRAPRCGAHRVRDQPLDDRLGLLEIGGADIHDIGQRRVAQELGAR